MAEQLQAIRGMSDVLPTDAAFWHRVEQVLCEVLCDYGYREIRVPIVERTELFRRSIGEATDIVEKEMYSFEDRNGVSLTLRPEATAGIVRAAIEHGMLRNQRHKLWCTGPMFRYEKPQKGRYRQFHQFDIEALGYEGPDVDAEMIVMTARIWRLLGVRDLSLQINSLGVPASRTRYRDALTAYLGSRRAELDEDSLRRLERNPMRILDSKNPAMAAVVADAPVLTEYLDAASIDHFAEVRSLLEAARVPYQLNPRLVRGLDYYNLTVFEWVTDKLGAQGAVCAGGRYDGLVAELGGQPTPAIGCALGLERVVELYRLGEGPAQQRLPHVYLVAVGPGASRAALTLAESLRDERPDLRVEMNCGGGGFKAQMRRADQSGAAAALILGEDEIAAQAVGIKALREERPQITVQWAQAAESLTPFLRPGMSQGT